MRLRISALAEYASISVGNKLNILGIFTRIHSPSVPCKWKVMQLIVQMIFEPGESNTQKEVKIYIQDSDGNNILQLQGVLVVPPSIEHEPVSINQLLQLEEVVFPEYGQYEVKLDIDEETFLLSPLEVVIPES